MPKTLSTRNTVRDIGASHKKVEDGTLESPEEFVRKLLGRTTFFPRVHALKQQTPPSTRRRRLLVGGNSHEVAIERNSPIDRKSTRLNSSHVEISYAVFCLKKKKKTKK